jgi:hypothetical protein
MHKKMLTYLHHCTHLPSVILQSVNCIKRILVLAGLLLRLTCTVFSQVNPNWDTLYYYKSATSGAPEFVNPALIGTPISKSTFGWINSTPCITGFSGFGISPAQSSYNSTTNPYIEFTIEPTNPAYSFNVERFSVRLRSSSIGANFVMMAYSLNDGGSWISKGVPDSPNISATCGVTASRIWNLPSAVLIGGGIAPPRIKIRLFYFNTLGFLGGNNQVLDFVIHGRMNNPVDYYTISSGNMSDAIWSPSPIGTVGQRVYFTPEINATIQGGHIVNADRRDTPFRNLTVKAGAELKANSADSINLNYISIFENLVVDGLLGNALAYDALGVQIEGANVVLAGNGLIHPGKIRKQYSINSGSNLQLLASEVSLHYPGTALYNNSANTNLNVFVPSGKTLRVIGNGSIPGSVSIDGPSESDPAQKGGRIDIAGLFVVNGQFSVASANNNALFPCLFNVQSTGLVNVNNLVVRNNGINLTTFSPGSSVTVSGIMKHLEGLLNTQNELKFLTGASLLHGASTPGVLPYTGGQLEGNIKFQAQGSEEVGVYNYWSSPVSSIPISVINTNGASTGSLLNTYHYDANFATSTTVQGLRDGWVHLTSSDLMQAGRGYITTSAGSVLFDGPANDGTILISPIEGPFTRFNLVGNPYPGPISANQFILENQSSAIFPALYFWDDDASLGQDYTASDYIVSNAVGTVATGGNNAAGQFAGRIAAGQGFFVEARTNATNVRFSNAMRTSGSTSFFEDSLTFAKYWIRVSGESAASETLIAFGDDATVECDGRFDAKMFSVNSVVSLGSVINDSLYAIQSRPTIQNSDHVFLGVNSMQSGNYTFQIVGSQNTEESVLVYLYDHLENLETCLNNQTYTVFLPVNEASLNRFELRFSSPVKYQSISTNCHGQEGGINLTSNEPGWSYLIQGDHICCPISGTLIESSLITLPEGEYSMNLTHALSNVSLEYFPEITAPEQVEAELIASQDHIVTGQQVSFQIISPQNLEISWSLDNLPIATGSLLENLLINQAGIHNLLIQMENEFCNSTILEDILVLENSGLGITQVENLKIRVFPNPANNQLCITLPESYLNKKGKLLLRNQVSADYLEFNFTDCNISINTSNMPSGIYLIQILGEEDSIVQRVAIIH